MSDCPTLPFCCTWAATQMLPKVSEQDACSGSIRSARKISVVSVVSDIAFEGRSSTVSHPRRRQAKVG